MRALSSQFTPWAHRERAELPARPLRTAAFRRSASWWIRFRPRSIGPMDPCREEELTSTRERRSLARSVSGIVEEVQPRWLAGAAPLNRVALRSCSDELTALADRLADLERPVSGAGIVQLRELLANGGSPLYLYGDASRLRETLAAVREVLDPGA